jgi:hypothetical protein
MEKLIAVGFAILLGATTAQAKSMKLELYAQTSLAPKITIAKEKVGGLSGMFVEGTKLVAVSDDRGKLGPSRFYELELKITAGKVELTPTKAQHLKDVPPAWILDLEGLAPLKNGDLLLTTEGDNNKKPRAMPHVFVTSNQGVYKTEVPVPDKFLPETTGLQSKGIENNKGFEGLSAKPGGQGFYLMNEYPIVTDQGNDSTLWLRLVEFQKDKDSFKAKSEYAYSLSKVASNGNGAELFRGVSEILSLPDNKLLVLERGARLSKSGLAYSGALYLVDITGAPDVSGVKNLSEGKSVSLKKELLVDLEDLLKTQTLDNFEALSLGPVLPDGRKSLLVLSDNNFSSKEKTTLLVFAIKEVE